MNTALKQIELGLHLVEGSELKAEETKVLEEVKALENHSLGEVFGIIKRIAKEMKIKPGDLKIELDIYDKKNHLTYLRVRVERGRFDGSRRRYFLFNCRREKGEEKGKKLPVEYTSISFVDFPSGKRGSYAKTCQAIYRDGKWLNWSSEDEN